MQLSKFNAALALVALAQPLAAAVLPVLPGQPVDDKMVEAAMADPAAYIDVLVNCAAYHGTVAVKKSNGGVASKGHDDKAIMLLATAALVPPQDEDAVNDAYTEKLFSFVDEIDKDKTGEIEQGLMKLGEVCGMVEQYAEATLRKAGVDVAMPVEGSAAPPVEPVEPEEMFDALFAEGTDKPSAWRGLYMDCAAYHATRRDPDKDGDLTGKSEELTFLAAAVSVAPGASAKVESDHQANIARYAEAKAHDTTGEIARELASMKGSCASMLPIAEKQVETAKAAD